MSDNGTVLRSQSSLLQGVHDTISVALKKPRIVELLFDDRLHVFSLAKKLFTSPSTSTYTSSHLL